MARLHKISRDEAREVRERYGIRLFVETGTWRGDTLAEVCDIFDRCWSIEIRPERVARARARLSNKRNVTIVQGDSGLSLYFVLERIIEPVFVWLDAHDPDQRPTTPIIGELYAVTKWCRFGSLVWIDDLRGFEEGRMTREYPKRSWPNVKTLIDILRGWRVKLNRDLDRLEAHLPCSTWNASNSESKSRS